MVNTAVVPLESARRTTVIGRSGSLISGLAATIFGSFHLVILPRKPEFDSYARKYLIC